MQVSKKITFKAVYFYQKTIFLKIGSIWHSCFNLYNAFQNENIHRHTIKQSAFVLKNNQKKKILFKAPQ